MYKKMNTVSGDQKSRNNSKNSKQIITEDK